VREQVLNAPFSAVVSTNFIVEDGDRDFLWFSESRERRTVLRCEDGLSNHTAAGPGVTGLIALLHFDVQYDDLHRSE